MSLNLRLRCTYSGFTRGFQVIRPKITDLTVRRLPLSLPAPLFFSPENSQNAK
jgi:hypothetical protein